jgi:hypothetical protein
LEGEPVKAVYGLYGDADTAERAVNRLRALGVADREITIVTSEPIETHDFASRDKATWMFWIASGGALIGLVFATWLTTHTQTSWPIVTGGMPIVTWWPNLIIMFELTMLGAILATVITLLVTAGIPFGTRSLYDPEVSNGQILVGVENPRVNAQDIERTLSDAGPGRVKVV